MPRHRPSGLGPDRTDTVHLLPPGRIAGLFKLACCDRWAHEVRHSTSDPAKITCIDDPAPVFFVAPNAWDEPSIWRVVPGKNPAHCLNKSTTDPDLWNLIVGAIRAPARTG